MNRNSQNLQHHLLARESNLYPGRRHPIPSSFLFHERNFYKSITPRLTVQNVDRPLGYFRKFSPNGKHLLMFTTDQKSLDVYQYLGVANAAGLLSKEENECITADSPSMRSIRIRHELFRNLFKKQYHIPIVTVPTVGRQFLNRDFSIFLDGGNFVLLASISGGCIFPNISVYTEFVDMLDDTELYDTTFYLIDLRNGRITDTIKMENDYVVLSHNHSVSFWEPTVAILSTYRQCIDLYLFDSTAGQLKRLHTVGPFLTDLDRDRVLSHLADTNFVVDPSHNLPFSSIKQKILTHIYLKILGQKSACDRKIRLKEFYKNFILYERMVLLRMQLFDNNNLLLQFDKRQSQMPLQSLKNKNDNFKIYVFYNITTQEVLRVFDNESLELLKIVRNYCHHFRNSHSLFVPWHSSSPSNNDIFRKALDRAIVSSPGGLVEAATQFNPSLPISSQCFSTSPYLDYSLFDYDDRHISTLERPRLNSQEPIRFLDRDTGLLKFSVFLEQGFTARQNIDASVAPSNLVTYIFHPYEPFFISVQKFTSRYVINFHLYSSKSVPKM